ncbi:MAG: polyhydroxyalkanoic acid system family protein [Burkholderiaceae bacterium]|nr:polyhydroxyalkanoic acid system family protein [Burkholderiaceae bacterium]
MSDIHIRRDHGLGLDEARKVAHAWAEKAQQKFDMECHYQAGEAQDKLLFHRSGVKGWLEVDGERFELHATLGFLFSAFKQPIEAEITAQLDKLLGTAAPRA